MGLQRVRYNWWLNLTELSPPKKIHQCSQYVLWTGILNSALSTSLCYRENNLTMCIIDKILLRQRPMGRAADRLHASLLHVPVMFVFTRHFCIIQRLASLLCYKYREWCYAQNVQDQCIYVKCNLLTFHKFAWIYNVCISVLPLWAI